MSEWYKDAFDEFYLEVYSHRDEGEADEFVDLLGETVRLEGLMMLDICCGEGRYLRAPGVLRVFSGVRAELDCRLVLIGDGPERLPAERLCAQLGIEKDVLFLGNQECIERILPVADVLLLPSEHESFGLVCLEAMSCGVTAVATNVGGTKEVIEHGRTGFLHDPFDIEGMVTSILGLLQDGEKRNVFGREARKVAIEKFEISAVVRRYVELYERTRDRVIS